MAQQTIGATRHAQRVAGSQVNANFNELYARQQDVALTAAANTTFVVPAGYLLEHVAYQNTTANAVTGGLKIGTTNGGTEVVTAQAVTANETNSIAGASISKRMFSATAATTLYLQAVTAWNGASLNVRVTVRKMF